MFKWLAVSALFFLVVVELTLFAPKRADRKSTSGLVGEIDTSERSDIEQVLSGTHLVESQGEKKMWALDADQAQKKKNSQDWELDKVEVEFFGEDDVQYECTGDKGFVTENQKELKIEHDVVITSTNGYVLKTRIIFYYTDRREIIGPEKAYLEGEPGEDDEGGPLYMESDRFRADLSTNRIFMSDNVRGRKQASDGRMMHITSDEAEFSARTDEVWFRGNVVMTMETMKVTGPRARFIYREGVLDSLFMDGGVQFNDVGRWGVAGEAEVFFKEDKSVFRDNPKVVQGDDQLIGEEIIVYDKGDRIKVYKAKSKYHTKEDGEEGF